jgi:hypothetical protein
MMQRNDAIRTRIRERTIMETVAKQAPTSSNEIAKLIRKLRWARLEEEAEQLEKELEEHAAAPPGIPESRHDRPASQGPGGADAPATRRSDNELQGIFGSHR